MKQYVVDELRPADYEKVKRHLDDTAETGSLDGVYWIPVRTSLLTPEQARHKDCHPLCFALCLDRDRLCCELLLRTHHRIRCTCIDYATVKQRNWIIRQVDAMFKALDIKI
ncbi:MAG: hypothetical protein C4530_04945 [Desulfobacteraceae bacterium]|nr:MAG: hypothetical protein C4530_04945 [Desulfobacteraceae bacterium]